MTSEPREVQALLVEDNAGDALLLTTVLGQSQRFSFACRRVTRLSEALEALAASGYDMVFLDLSLPDGDDVAVLDRVRDRAPSTPVLVLTGWMDPERSARCQAHGAIGALDKSGLMEDDFVTRIEHTVARALVA